MRLHRYIVPVLLALVAAAPAASITDTQIQALCKNWARSIDTIYDAVTFVQADIAAQHNRLNGITDDQGVGALMLAGLLRDSVNLNWVTLAANAFRGQMTALNNAFRDPNLTPKGNDGTTTYGSMSAYITGEFEAGERVENPVVQVWRSIFGQGSLPAAKCAPPVAVSYGTNIISAVDSITYTVVATPVSTNYYDGGLLEVYVTTLVQGNGDSAVAVTVNGTDRNGSAWVGTASIPDSSIATTVVEITPQIANTYAVKLTRVDCTQGSSGAFTVRTKRDHAYSQ